MQQASLFPATAISVSEITRHIQGLLEGDGVLQDVWVAGEVSNLSQPPSGHIYFSIKDERAGLKCVIWRTAATRLRHHLQNGAAIEAHGYVGVYERDGIYQLYIDDLRPAGEGWLYQEFLRLKAALEAEGLFSEERKRVPPVFPQTVGIVTSPTGAALQDMLNTLSARYPLAQVILAPSSVQGDKAPGEIVCALNALNKIDAVDVILLARGGGSLEDLWSFNDERVVRAVAASIKPVITGVGHETDFTLVDFATDVRAPTPTAAAVAAVPDQFELRNAISDLDNRLTLIFDSAIQQRQQAYRMVTHRLLRASPGLRIRSERQRLGQLNNQATLALNRHLQILATRSRSLESQLKSLSPTAVLGRGYAVVRDQQNQLVRSIANVRTDDRLDVQVLDGNFAVKVSSDPLPRRNKENGNER
ncbi:MAG: exodeoxyribonuclease VII large subunit [Anaerolineae bacterium]|nr:exodeoxyribonuclease VII large subunit [Anaerolineae bacterium]